MTNQSGEFESVRQTDLALAPWQTALVGQLTEAMTADPDVEVIATMPPQMGATAAETHPDWCKCQRVCGGDQ